MNFLFPIGFAFLALVPVVVVLYLLKVRRRPVAVPSLLLWQQVLAQKRRRSLFQKLRQWLSLLLHLIILMLIIFALVRPVPTGSGEETGAAKVIVLDDRARMQAAGEGEASRFERAMAVAREAGYEAGPGKAVAVLTTAGRPRVVQPFTHHRAEVRSALAGLGPQEASGNLEAATQLARELAEGREQGSELVVLTDEPQPEGWEGGEWINVADRPLDNLAITQFAARATPNSPETAEVLVEITNFSREKRAGNLELRQENRLAEVRPFEIEPGATERMIFPALDARRKYANARGWLQAKLDTEDALAIDDTAYAVLPEARPIRVLLAGEGDLFLERALQSEPTIQLEVLPDADPEVARGFDVVLFPGEAPADWPWLEEGMPPTMVIGAVPPGLRGLEEESIERPLVTATDRGHPVGWLIDFEDLVLPSTGAMQLDEVEGWIWSKVVDAARSPVIVAGERLGTGERLVVVGFDPIQTDLPLRVAYPLLISNSLRWLAGRDQVLETFTAKAGQPVPLAPGEEAGSEVYKEYRPVVEDDSTRWQSRLFVPMETGFYRTRGEEGGGWVAVSLADPASSNLLQLGGGTAVAAVEATTDQSSADSDWLRWLVSSPLPLWGWLALGAALLFTGEWWWFHRRRTE